MKINVAKQKLLAGETVVGYSLKLPSLVVAEFMGRCGADFLYLDTQHGSWGEDSVIGGLAAVSSGPATPMARVSSNRFHRIGRLLDAGALGIIVPLVNTRADAQAAADACRFPPVGTRSYGTGRCLVYGDDYPEWINDQVFVAVQIETVEAVDNAEAILSVPGVDGCMVGPADLALSLGFPPKEAPQREEHARALERVLTACRNTGKIPGIDPGNIEQAARHGRNGYRFLVVGADLRMLSAAAAGGIRDMRQKLAG
ncbi:MAG: 4-hydroxy-2-oxo-heptane-1,7-dioate aldolase [Chloroflexi bacterium ADurb.Bin325]|nr:MAG: 4-hydroxy-2-oxo-heptane-1,7-dioate aldolase [Chloroflexi bacterium ADurb.Bin325]